MANNRNLNRTNYGVSLPDNILGYVRIMGFSQPLQQRRDHHLRLPPRRQLLVTRPARAGSRDCVGSTAV